MSTSFLSQVDFSFLENKEFLLKINQVEASLAELRIKQEVLKYSFESYEVFLTPLSIKESVKSSGIENIFTTTLDVLQGQLLPTNKIPKPEKEVLNYKQALLFGYQQIRKKPTIDLDLIQQIQNLIQPKKSGFRNKSGTKIVNAITGRVVHTPPQTLSEIYELLEELMPFINLKKEIHPLALVAICHYQFESIHPFFDGNGRVGRILMVLQLILAKKLSLPTLFLSGYILKTRTTYYDLLDQVRRQNNWQDWIMYILTTIQKQAEETLQTMDKFLDLLKSTRAEIQTKAPKIATKFNYQTLFQKPYISQKEFARLNQIHLNSASKYLNQLEESGVLNSKIVKKQKLYFLKELIEVLA